MQILPCAARFVKEGGIFKESIIIWPTKCVIIRWQSTMRNIKLSWCQMATDQGVREKEKEPVEWQTIKRYG